MGTSPNPTTTSLAETRTAIDLPTDRSEKILKEQIEAARVRIFSKVSEKYPTRPFDFRMRKVNKQIASIYPGATSTFNGLLDTSNMVTPQPGSVDGNSVRQAVKDQATAAGSPGDTIAMDLDDEEHRSLYGRNLKLNPTVESAPQNGFFGSRSAVQLPPAGSNGACGTGNGEVESDPDHKDQYRSPSVVDKPKSRGVLVGFYRLSEAEDDRDKHAVYGKIDKGGDLFTTVSKENRYGEIVPHKQYLASKVQCHTDKIGFEPHLEELNKAQLKAYVIRRLEADWTNETEEGRRASELKIAEEVRHDATLIEKGLLNDVKKSSTAITSGVKRAYDAFADEDDAGTDDESPLSEVDEHMYRESDDEDAFVPSGSSHKKRKSGRKSINARTAKGHLKETEEDDIKDGVLIGVWKLSPEEAFEEKHAVYSYLDARDSLWSRVFHVSKNGKHIDMAIPFPRGTVKWEDIILDDHLDSLDREGVKEYVRENRRMANSLPVGDYAVKKERKPRKSSGEQVVKQEYVSTSRISKANSILLGYWKLSAADDEREKNAVFGYVDSSDRFNLQVRKHTREGQEIFETNINFPGNGRVQQSNVVMEDHLKDLVGAEVQAFTRKALESGVPLLEGQAKKDLELKIVGEILAARKSEPAVNGEVPAPDQPRLKRKYTRRVPRLPPAGVAENAAVNEASDMRGASPAPSRSMYDHPLGFPGYSAHPPMAPLAPPPIIYGPNGSLIHNGVEYFPTPPKQPPLIYEDGSTIIHDGLRFSLKSSGAFKGKYVHSYGQLLSINGDDYAEYRVLSRTDV